MKLDNRQKMDDNLSPPFKNSSSTTGNSSSIEKIKNKDVNKSWNQIFVLTLFSLLILLICLVVYFGANEVFFNIYFYFQ